jgi:mitogen-activated protein kinase kinase kinase
MLEAGLGLQLDDDMDPETRALIEQFQREEEEARQVVEERRRQEEADAEFARKEQQSERDVWQMMQQMQLEQRRREQEQIEQDERQAVSWAWVPGVSRLIPSARGRGRRTKEAAG